MLSDAEPDTNFKRAFFKSTNLSSVTRILLHQLPCKLMAESELNLLDKVLFQCAVTSDYIAKILVPVIDKLDSPHEASKNKVLEILTHLNKRVKPRPTIKLPIVEIATKLTSSSGSQKSFLLMYLQMGFERCEENEKLEVAKILIPNLHLFTEDNQYSFLSTILPVIDKVDVEKGESFMNEKVRAIVLKYFIRVMLLSQTGLQNGGNPGLTAAETTLVLKGMPSIKTLKELNNLKSVILKFIEVCRRSTLFSHDDFLPIAVIAFGDTTSQISEKGEDLVKSLKQVDLESKSSLTLLFQMFVGIPNGAEKKLPVNIQIKEKIMDIFLKSKLSCNSFPSTIQVVFEALFGVDTNSKIQLQGLRYIDWICRLASSDQLKVMGPMLLNGLKKILNDRELELNLRRYLEDPNNYNILLHGVPVPIRVRVIGNDTSSKAITIKSLAYQCLGQLGKRMPNLFSKNFDLLKSFFETISEEKDQNVRQSLQDGLVNLCVAYKSCDSEMKDKILELLFDHVAKNNIQSKYLANYYALRLFPFSHVPSRYLNIISLNESSPQIKDESSRGLKPFSLEDEESVLLKADPEAKWPSFQELMTFLSQKKNLSTNEIKILPFPSVVLQSILQFASETLKRQHNSAGDSNDEIISTIASFGNDIENKDNILNIYWNLLQPTWHTTGESSQDLLSLSLRNTLDLFAFKEYSSLSLLVYSELETLLGTCTKKGGINRLCRELSAKIVGIGYSNGPLDESEKVVSALLNQLNTVDEKVANREIRVGTIFALGYTVSHILENRKELNKELFSNVILTLVGLCKQSFYIGVSAQSLGLIFRYYDANLVKIEKDEKPIVIHQTLISCLQQSDDNNIELIVIALSNICLGSRIETILKEISDSLLKLFKKRLEAHFTIGESLSVIASGWDSTASVDPLIKLFKDENRSTPATDEPLRSILQTMLSSYLLSDRVDTRSPAAIWLLSLIKHSGKHPVILRNLFDIQKAFSFLLSDNDEVIQESAAKGLALVYECGSEEIRQKLVNELVTTIAQGKGGFKVTANSELFPEGFLGNTPSGNAITSYKDIVGMAEDLNQPEYVRVHWELVYKFMGLATHNALWNSKKGAAFAANVLSTQTGGKIELKGHLQQLIPKLYRSSYDPSYNVSQSMTQILDSFATRKEIHENYFDIIIQDLLDNIWSLQWRTREACCSAMSDILTGKTMDKVEPYIADIWPKVFKVSDDEKETVRTAAAGCLKTVGNLTVRLCDPTKNTIPQGKIAIELVLPYLCQKGLLSQVKEVREFSMELILKIVKVAGLLLIPYVSMLVSVLLNALDELEEGGGQMNYLQVQAEKLGLTDAVESARIAISTNSPLNDTLKLLIDEIDKNNVAAVVDVLLHTLLKSVGLQARVGASKFLQQLASAKSELVVPYLPKLLAALQKSVFLAKSPAVKQAYSQCMGYLCRYTEASVVEKLINELTESYSKSDPDDKPTRKVVAIVFLELSKSSTGVLNPFYKNCVPLIFLGRHEAEDDTKKLFQDTWGEIGAGISLYTGGIVNLIIESLNSNSWAMKKQAANSLETLLVSLNSDSIEPFFPSLVDAIRKGLRGSTWEGKESIVSALGSLVSNGKTIIQKNFDQYKTIPTDLLNETRREKKPFKHRVIHTLTIVMDSIREINPQFDIFEDFYNKLEPIINTTSKKEDDDEDKKEEEEKKKENLLDITIRASAITALVSAWPSTFSTQQKFAPSFLSLLTTNASNLANNLVLKMACINALTKFVTITQISKENHDNSILTTNMLQLILDSLSNNFMDPATSVRSGALKTLKTIIERCANTELLKPLAESTLKKLTQINSMFPNKHYEIDELTLSLKQLEQ